jgi:hypothetical protein
VRLQRTGLESGAPITTKEAGLEIEALGEEGRSGLRIDVRGELEAIHQVGIYICI